MKHFGLLTIIIFAIAIRVLLYSYAPRYLMLGDSVSYYLTLQKIVKTKTIADQWRTPMYPLLLSVPFVLTRTPIPEDVYFTYSPHMQSVRIAQSLSGVLTSVILFYICIELGIPIVFSVFLSLLGTTDVMLLYMEHALLTESFTLFVLSLGVLLELKLFRRFDIAKYAVMAICFLLSMMLRPGFIVLPAVLYMLLFLRHRTAKVFLSVLVAFSIYIGCIQGFIALNSTVEGYHGISRISDINMWGKLLHAGVTPKLLPDTEVGDMAAQALKVNAKDPFEIFRENPVLYAAGYPGKFHEFVLAVAKQMPAEYVMDSLRSLPDIMRGHTTVIASHPTLQHSIFLFLERFYNTINYILYIPLIAFPIVLYMALVKKHRDMYPLLLIMVIGMYSIVVTASLTYDDFSRHMSVVRPFLFISAWILISWFIPARKEGS